MMTNIQNQAVRRIGLLDMLDEKSLANLKKFGHVYTDKYTGRTRMRVFKKK